MIPIVERTVPPERADDSRGAERSPSAAPAELTVEFKVHEIECAVDDLTSLAHSPEGARAIAMANLEGIERRLRYLRFDLLAQQAAE